MTHLKYLASSARLALLETFGREASAYAQAPGRVNLIGEHTDYNDGFVLPCAIDRAVVVAFAPRPDRLIRAVAVDANRQTDSFGLDAEITRLPETSWAQYVRGVVQALQTQTGALKQGLDLAIAGNVPAGAGLSSSAALEVAVGHTVMAANGLPVEPKALAVAAQIAENEFVGCRCGIMDQLVSACGQAGHALLIDCRSLDTDAIALPRDISVLIVHSGVKRGLVESAYNERRLACERAAAQLGVRALRDATLNDVLRADFDVVTRKRAMHVVTENDRTLAAATSLAKGDLRNLGSLMAASHASMRDDFEITVPAIDQLVELIRAEVGDEGGVRMTGGGFGGCVVALVPTERVARVRSRIESNYRTPNGEPALILVSQASAGSGLFSD